MEKLEGLKSYLSVLGLTAVDGLDLMNLPKEAWYALAALVIGKGIKDGCTALAKKGAK